ncbi:hypothetical protein HYT23_02770 [Candidatus Pacearchaeota archaeon]|nr:hypothetical protein [Candidatus Pacearchaeota archaeon]
MSELTIGQLIKIIIGVLVFAVVVLGLYFFFKNYILDFFNGLGGEAVLGLR